MKKQTANPPNKHHHSPEFYLKGFCNENEKIWRYDKQYDHFREVYPSAIMFEHGTNTFDMPWGKDASIETGFFSRLEQDWQGIVHKIHESRAKNIDLKITELADLTQFIAWQYVRAPFFIEEIQKEQPTLTKFGNFAERMKRARIVQQMLLSQEFTFHIATTNTKFITSDKPCFLYLNYSLKCMPISADIFLSWDDAPKNSKARLMRWEMEESKVMGLNELIASDAKRYVAGPNKEELNRSIIAVKHHPNFFIPPTP